jgi:hypothetical protein
MMPCDAGGRIRTRIEFVRLDRKTFPAADVGREPKAIKAGRDQLKQGAAAYHPEKVAALASESDFLASDQPA